MSTRPAMYLETTRRRVPFFLWGQRIEPSGSANFIEMPSGVSLVLPSFDEQLARRLTQPPENPLRKIPTQEIIAFLHRVGQYWKNDEYARRRLYIRELRRMHGYSTEMAEAEADLISSVLSAHTYMHDLIAVELGHRAVLDRWVPREDCEVRAFPRGVSLHLLPGNVPFSTTVSLLRALLTKNLAILKFAAREPATAVHLAGSLADVDPQHPVTRSVSAVFWDHDSALGRDVAYHADVICVWGGAEAAKWAHRQASPEGTVVVYGPKRSIAMIGHDADLGAAARGVAHDVCMYEQRACFSTHQVFVQGDPHAFAVALRAELERYAGLLPRTAVTFDESARASLEIRAQQCLGAHVSSGAWGAIVVTDPTHVVDLPGARTVFLHAVEDLTEVYPWVDGSVQTVSVSPWSLTEPHRDALADRGVSRLVEAGLAPLFRLGGSHDGLQPLGLLTRMVSVESPISSHGKAMVVPVDQSDFLEHRRLRDLLG